MSAMAASDKSNRAIVVGASIAGLLTARVLSEYFDQVMVFDRDALPNEPSPRASVPQEHHVHLLLERGKRIMEGLFPGLMAELEEEGALVADLCLDVKCHQAGSWKRRWPSGITAHYCTRTLLEFVLRRRVRALPNVSVLDGTPVIGMTTSSGNDRVTGVRVELPLKGPIDMPAKLIVDATGRGSKAETWLEQAGFGKVVREEIVTQLGYVSRIYDRPDDARRDWQVLLCLPKLPEQKRMAVISPIEGNRWMVTAGAWFNQQPAPEEAAFLDYLRNLPIPDLFLAVAGAKPKGDIKRYRMPGGLRRRYDQMNRWPEGFLVIGDAVCSINPIYSQGMSASALQVAALMPHLERLQTDRTTMRNVQSVICAAADLPWRQAANVEQQFATESAPAGPMERLKQAYLGHLLAATAVSRPVAIAVLKVNNLVAKPSTLFAPGLALSALLAKFQNAPDGRRG